MIDIRTTILLPIDMQQAFDGPAWPKKWNADCDANGLKLLDAWRHVGGTVIHVRHNSIEENSTLREGAPGHAFRPGFEPLPGEALVEKSVNAAFIGTDLDLRLKRLGVSTVIAFGITTDMCVSTTIRTGANLGWEMMLVEDACDCLDLPGPDGETIPAREVHKVHVATLGFEFCTVTSTADLIAGLS